MSQQQQEAAVALRRARMDACKANYAHYGDLILEQVIRFNTAKAAALSSDLADGSAAKKWRHAGDLNEALQQIASARDDLLLVAEAARELLAERVPS